MQESMLGPRPHVACPRNPGAFSGGLSGHPVTAVMTDTQAWAVPPTLPSPKVCSLVQADIGLLQLVNTLAGHGSIQAAHSAAQHSFHDLHQSSSFALFIHYADLCTATTLPVLEAAGQGQALREGTWQSGFPQHALLTPQSIPDPSCQRLRERVP